MHGRRTISNLSQSKSRAAPRFLGAMRNAGKLLAFGLSLAAFLALTPVSAQTRDDDETDIDSPAAVPAVLTDRDGAIAPERAETQNTVYDFSRPDLAATAGAIRQLVEGANWRPSRVSIDWKAIRFFYEKRNFTPAWANAAFAEKVHAALVHASDEGLSPADYAADAIVPPANDDPERFARFDVLLTSSFLLYVHDVHQGRIPPSIAYDDIGLAPAPFDPASRLLETIRNGRLDAFIASLPPPQPEYRALRSLLARYRQFEANGGWQAVSRSGMPATRDRGPDQQTDDAQQAPDQDADETPDQSENAEKDDQRDVQRSPRMRTSFRQQLVARLAAEGYQGALKDSLQAFQRNHDLEPTGAVDSDTLQELNVDVKTRIIQIEANMERWRWMPRAIEQRYVVVNVPEERLAVMNAGQPRLVSKVVVGRESDPTPILRATASSVTVNPVWHIPQDIAEDEILPKGSSYLHEQRIQVTERGNLKQLPGPKNALGTLKINMPNRFNIYMHDTPGKATFTRNERDESHGCVRVQKILELGSVLLAGNPDVDVAKLKTMIASGKTTSLTLTPPVPVYVVYWSVTTGEDGSAQFWPDLYSRDLSLIAEIQKRNVNRHVSV